MDRKYKSGAVVGAPDAADNASDGYPTAGNPGSGIPATAPGPYLYFMLVEELLSIIAAGGVTPDKTVITQVRDAVRNMMRDPQTIRNLSVVPTVAANALTLTTKAYDATTALSATVPAFVGFRDVDLSDGNFNVRAITGNQSLTVPSTSTLGHSNSDSRFVYVYEIDNAGTPELAISSKFFGYHGIGSTSAIGGGASSATVMYSTTARSNVPYRAVYRFTAPQTVAGTWASGPNRIEPAPFIPNTNPIGDVSGDVITANAGTINFVNGVSLQGNGNNAVVITTGGVVQMPQQPRFFASLSALANNVTGAAVPYTLIANTEVYDVGSHYNNANGQYAAVHTGTHLLGMSVGVEGAGASHVSCYFNLTTSNRTYALGHCIPYTDSDGYGRAWRAGSIPADMDAGDVATIVINEIHGATTTLDVSAGSSFFGIFLG